MEENKVNIFIKSYWNYYLELEDQFIATKKFVEFDASNSATYSVEYLKLLTNKLSAQTSGLSQVLCT